MFVLIVIWTVAGNISLTTHEFTSLATCEAAKKLILSRTAFSTAECLPK